MADKSKHTYDSILPADASQMKLVPVSSEAQDHTSQKKINHQRKAQVKRAEVGKDLIQRVIAGVKRQ